MPAKIIEKNIVFGIMHIKPLHGFPNGRIRLRLRPNDFASVWVRTPDGIREFYIEDIGEKWIPAFEKGRNHTAESLTT